MELVQSICMGRGESYCRPGSLRRVPERNSAEPWESCSDSGWDKTQEKGPQMQRVSVARQKALESEKGATERQIWVAGKCAGP